MDRLYVMQLVRSFQRGELTRRDFLQKATIALGSVATANILLTACGSTQDASLPPATQEQAQEAEPAAEGGEASNLVTETVNYQDPDGESLMGYLARPAEGDPKPGVIVIQEWWGLNEHIQDVTRRFAEEGYVALAPDLYKGVVVTEPDEAMKLVMELDMPEAVREIQHAIDFLQAQDYVAGEAVGVIGFCMGGGLALQTAVAEEDLGAAVAFYGRPLPPEQVGQVKAPVLGLYGADDQGIPVPDVQAMEKGLADAGIEHEIQIYEGAGHAFFNDTAQSFNQDAATDAWQRTLAWFGEKLPAT
jgi:carboxymethylenebutenolidase